MDQCFRKVDCLIKIMKKIMCVSLKSHRFNYLKIFQIFQRPLWHVPKHKITKMQKWQKWHVFRPVFRWQNTQLLPCSSKNTNLTLKNDKPEKSENSCALFDQLKKKNNEKGCLYIIPVLTKILKILTKLIISQNM